MKKQKNSLKKTEAELIDDPLAGDMSDFILDGIKDGSWQVAKYELREKKDKVLSLRLSQKLLNELKKQAKKSGLDTQKFVRIILENTIRKKNWLMKFRLFAYFWGRKSQFLGLNLFRVPATAPQTNRKDQAP